MVAVIAYIRVSTKTQSQSQKGHSLDGQKLELKAYAKASGVKIHKFFHNDESARHEENSSERPGFIAATELALKKKWPILVADASRFSRTEESYDRFIDAGGVVYDTDGFGADEAKMRAKIRRAKHDGDIRSKATREGQAKARANGVKFGSPQIAKANEASGKKRSTTGRIRRDEFRREYGKARAAGFDTPEAAAGYFNDNGYTPPLVESWTPSNVRRILNDIRLEDEAEISASTGSAVPEPAFSAKVFLTRLEIEALEKQFRSQRFAANTLARRVGNLSKPMPKTLRDRLAAMLRRSAP